LFAKSTHFARVTRAKPEQHANKGFKEYSKQFKKGQKSSKQVKRGQNRSHLGVFVNIYLLLV